MTHHGAESRWACISGQELTAVTEETMQYSMFRVFDTPFCVWDDDLDGMNKHFLNSFDPRFFDYLAQVHLAEVDTDNKKRAAMALRLSYLHGLETLFTLIGAALQAPTVALAWTLKCQPGDLRAVVQAITDGKHDLYTKWNLSAISWRGVSEHINCYDVPPSAPDPVEYFARLWEKLARDFLRDANRLEYNSLKHGLRVRHGASQVQIKEAGGEGQTYGGVEHGSRFWFPNTIERAPQCNFALRHGAVNWTPERLAAGLKLISDSANNVVSFLKVAGGAPPEEAPVRFPEQDDGFECLKDTGVSLANLMLGTNISARSIEPFARSAISKRLSAEQHR